VQLGQAHALLLVAPQGLDPGLHRPPVRGDREFALAQYRLRETWSDWKVRGQGQGSELSVTALPKVTPATSPVLAAGSELSAGRAASSASEVRPCKRRATVRDDLGTP
jgi:hypothetical protein